ncbi:hypothetical protein [Burkholderia vietnamiensis]|uniref:hypothetical protein n=1 Tax=Burkholderia vietnamiensis TaxID=60552 RepID=UPI00158F20EF|nr:hypothetical protein [Burkholderia vietnamiensis]
MGVTIKVVVPGATGLPHGYTAFSIVEVPIDDKGNVIDGEVGSVVRYEVYRNGETKPISSATLFEDAVSDALAIIASDNDGGGAPPPPAGRSFGPGRRSRP